MASSEETCAVCGRSILAGERTRGYLDREGERRSVCELCRARAERLGWTWEEAAEQQPAAPARRPRRSIVALWRGRSAWGQGKEKEEEEAGEEEGGESPPDTPVEDSSPDPAAAGARVERLEPESQPSLSPFERAIDSFNASEATRTVAGLMRTLGKPSVSVGAAAGSPSEVRITVAWELTWYQWGVDLAEEEPHPVSQLDRGSEITQLDRSARQWNASAAPGGRLLLGLPAAERVPDGEPVG